MTFKKADMAKTLETMFSMIETNPLDHKWLDFVILTGLVLHQFQTKWLLSHEKCEYRAPRKRRRTVGRSKNLVGGEDSCNERSFEGEGYAFIDMDQKLEVASNPLVAPHCVFK